VGFDFICKDISRDYKKQECAIIEANSMPYVDMHQNPSHGENDNVARDTWNIVVSRIIA
jgi:D-alanine-D-alanine ligase-like ATP-grasp enzyme